MFQRGDQFFASEEFGRSPVPRGEELIIAPSYYYYHSSLYILITKIKLKLVQKRKSRKIKRKIIIMAH